MFNLGGHRHRGSTRTANRQLAERFGGKRLTEALEQREGFRAPKPIKLSVHIRAYTEYTEKTHTSSN